MPRRQYQSEEDINLLRMALMEQQQNERPGRVPSGIAANAYLGSIPNTFEQDREGDVLGEMDRRYFQNQEDSRKRQSGVDDFMASATARQFETRRGVEEDPGTLAGSPAPQEMRTIRRFSENKAPIDPDAAATAGQKAMLAPSVMAEQIRSAGDLAEAKTRAAAGQQPDTTDADATRDEIIRLAEELKGSDALDRNVGLVDGSEWNPVTLRGTSKAFNAKAQRLRDLLSLEARSKLKGQGAVSDYEGKMLASSQAALRQNMDEGSFRGELDRIIGDQRKKGTAGVRRYNPATRRLE